VAASVTLLALMAQAQPPARAAQAAAPMSASAAGPAGASDAVLDVVMLVDESGSETDANVAEERQTAGTIAQTLLNPRSRVTVVGFGGVNHVAPGQNPVNVACQPTTVSSPGNLSYLSTCVNSLHRRSEQEGDDTDYAAALGQAMSYFNPGTTYGRQSPAGAIKVVLMMTDGGLDVHRDQVQYGQNWLVGAHHAVDLQLAAARADAVQVWPLGFGTISGPDQQYLNYLAANGAQTACDKRSVSKPHATVVSDPADALSALDTLYAAAGCLGSNRSSVPISGNQTRWLQVSIPGIASDAAISVDRGTPGVQVSFYEPDGTLWTDGSVLSGTSTAVEALHVTSPQPGRWRIKLVAPSGLASELVSATAFWQGAVDAIMTATPSSASPGQQIGVTLSVLGANGPITDSAALAQAQVAISVSGDGLSGPTQIPVSNTGETRGTATGVGDYKGTFTAPKGTGTLTFTGTAAGYGLYATEVPASVQVGNGPLSLQSTIGLPVVTSVQRGHGIQGNVLFTNRTGAARTVRLSLGVSHAYATLTSPAGTIQVPSGNPPATPFTVSFSRNSPLGPAWLQVKVVDATHPGIVYSAETLELTVTTPPGFVGQYLWEIAGVIVLLILAAVALYLRHCKRRQAADVRGLYVMVRRNGERVGAELKSPNKRAETFRFVIRDEGEPTERLDYPKPEDSVYAARRGGAGRVDVVTPAGEQYRVTIGGSGEPLPSGLQLAFRDARKAPSRRPPSLNGDRTSAQRRPPAPQPADQGPAAAPSPPDPWLT
jgi:hypothetical protein